MRESRVRLSTGTLPSPQLERLATLHPFVQQIDLVASSRIAQDAAFTSLNTTYLTAQCTLSELYEHVSHLSIPAVPFRALPLQRDADDTWCIDPRGILTLCVSKGLYEKLGLVGKKLPFKGCPERYVIQVPVKREATSVGTQARQRVALGIWDAIRAAEGLEKWHVAYVGAEGPSMSIGAAGNNANASYEVKDVTARVRREADVYVPRADDLDRLSTGETAEDHQERLEALFEWVGMACLGAQRLHAYDRVDPYVAVYEPPLPASVDELVHLRWKGLMDDTFVRSVIDTAISILSTVKSTGDNNAFIAIAMHSNLGTPVAYVPEFPEKEAPLRVPGPEAEDTVCLVLSKTSGNSTWAMAQSIGKWDARWG